MIRKFEPEDIDAIMSIWLNTNISAHPFINKQHWKDIYHTVEPLLPLSELFIWQDDNDIKAFIGISEAFYIEGLFVSKPYQSQGIGKKLLGYAKKQYPRLELDVFTKNDRAVRFYQNNGFLVERTTMNSDFLCEEHHMVWPALNSRY